jgi:hypothetical protein
MKLKTCKYNEFGIMRYLEQLLFPHKISVIMYTLNRI